MKAKRRLSTAFHPQTDGQTERQNQVLEQYLRAYVDYQQDDWVTMLPIAEFTYNNSVHSSTGVSPFYALYGYHPELTWDVDDDMKKGEAPAARERAIQINRVREQLLKRLENAIAYQKSYYDKHHKPKSYNVGDKVMLATKNLQLARPSKKLNHKFIGPYRILNPVGSQAYKINIPKTSKIHPVFHVSLLEPYQWRGDDKTPEPPEPILQEGQQEWEVEAILDDRIRRQKEQFLVRWKGYPPTEDSWQWKEDLEHAEEILREYQRKRA